MKLVFFQRDQGLVNRMLPMATALLCVLASIVPLHLPGFAEVAPGFVLMAVYHWSIYRPDLLPFAAVFLAGLALDLLNGAPLGVSSLVFLIGRAVVLSQRKLFVGRSFAVVWAGFLALVAAAEALEWALACALHGVALDPRPFLFQAVLTVALYPLVSYLLARVQRNLLMRA
jgi:rod shape-determining protein MreD